MFSSRALGVSSKAHRSPQWIALSLATLIGLGSIGPAFGQEQASTPQFASAADTAYIFNTLLFLIGGFLVMWMAAGFACWKWV